MSEIMKNGITILSKDEIVETNRFFDSGRTINDSLDFLEAKIRAKKLAGDLKKNLAAIAAIYWYDIITNHPFVDGNKRTAVEVMLNFLYTNNFRINCGLNALVYASLKIANKDVAYEKMVEWLFNKLEVRL
ncbi:hypothetical protein A3K63_05395 [Candidatus Micrarchaeota archaeon RBG_16_49_10]|nr:MAG: hypothetical protein A3K63_05395 [Candidatus Micrarchaeota archaeon RBG_16_49_10]